MDTDHQARATSVLDWIAEKQRALPDVKDVASSGQARNLLKYLQASHKECAEMATGSVAKLKATGAKLTAEQFEHAQRALQRYVPGVGQPCTLGSPPRTPVIPHTCHPRTPATPAHLSSLTRSPVTILVVDRLRLFRAGRFVRETDIDTRMQQLERLLEGTKPPLEDALARELYKEQTMLSLSVHGDLCLLVEAWGEARSAYLADREPVESLQEAELLGSLLDSYVKEKSDMANGSVAALKTLGKEITAAK